ncbi:MAG TPA: A/G-specific adenine glycosylase, partial [Myxococcota bacterium]|nr:A/G-specific adenine glycosylase [Myxococcota bacterium]
MNPGVADDLRRRLVEWFDRSARDLPWRRTRDPYAVWVSEVMLQQTRVDTVVPYYERFLARFPTVQSLADAPEDDVLRLWQGLGYYSRARNLQRAARLLAAGRGARMPPDAAGLRALPGVGRYTAGAVASIAYDAPEPILDGNVARVLVRLFGIDGDPRAPALAPRLWELAAALVPPAPPSPAPGPLVGRPTPARFNQAMMELGALVCLPVEPRCLLCPVHDPCAARRSGRQGELGGPRPRRAPEPVTRLVAAVERPGRLLWMRRAEGLLGGLWELPGLDGPAGGAAPPLRALAAFVSASCGVPVTLDPDPVGEVTHVFTHRRMTAHLHRAHPARGARLAPAPPYDGARWARAAAEPPGT